ncbi:MAG: hypothetical protein JWR21_2394 [Herminiimonas sp.]|nr:hypothetical protein [Herminiimonas sp.]MDB5854236.1 hypothetical protein [Herminiimonas sp.]
MGWHNAITMRRVASLTAGRLLPYAAVTVTAYTGDPPRSIAAGHYAMPSASVAVLGIGQLGGHDWMIHLGTARFELDLRLGRSGEAKSKGEHEKRFFHFFIFPRLRLC